MDPTLFPADYLEPLERVFTQRLAFLFKGAVIEANPSMLFVSTFAILLRSYRCGRRSRISSAFHRRGSPRGLLSLCASRPPKSHALTRCVFVDEFDSCRLESSSYSRFVGGRDRNLSIEDLDPTDRGNTDLRL